MTRSSRSLIVLPLLVACSLFGRRPGPNSEANGPPNPSSQQRPAERLRLEPLGPVKLVHQGRARSAIQVSAELMTDPKTLGKKRPRLPRAVAEARARLRESVKDLADYLEKISGAAVPIVTEPGAAPAGTIPILIGEIAEARFGKVGASAAGGQGFRVVVQRDAVGLFGESDLGTSYAIYELLFRLGCRWFMPGQLGEEIPRGPTIALSESDVSSAPSTLFRDVWYADPAFKRRNRLGGIKLAAGHRLERYISEAQRAEHPDWRATIGGVPHPRRLRWSNPEVADAISESIRVELAKRPAASVSLSPIDGIDFDDSPADRALDAADWDPSVNQLSLTDRLLVLSNRIATNLSRDYPELFFGLYAYASYTRPPLRENVHARIVPVIAPITYCRSHPITNDACPGARELRGIIEGWSKKAPMLAYRSYAFNLAEPSAPNPMIEKWQTDLPFVFGHGVRFFQPETLPNFETSLPALYLGIRLAWDTSASPRAIVDELFTRFYGHAARATRAYVDTIDRAWTKTPEYSGGNLGYRRRFDETTMARARKAMNAALAACKSSPERARVEMLDASLELLELYMKMDRDLCAGRISNLKRDAEHWRSIASALAERYRENAAFAAAKWAGADGVYAYYFRRFNGSVYDGADRVAKRATSVSKPHCVFQYYADQKGKLDLNASGDPVVSDVAWRTTDACQSTWASLGLYDYFGTVWYRTKLEFPAGALGKRAFLWLSRVDGDVRVWVGGKPARALADDDTALPSSEVHLKPLTFDLTALAKAGASTTLTIAIKRTRLTELGAGGLLGPVFGYLAR